MELKHKLIWIYWQQGYAQAPLLVQQCIDSWRKHHPDFTVHVLDETSLHHYVKWPEDLQLNRLDIPVQKVAALARLALLEQYGGIWVDATVFCCKPLGEWLTEYMENGFFAFRNPGPDRMMSNWFIAADIGNPIIRRLKNCFFTFFIRNYFSNLHTDFGKKWIAKLQPIFAKNHQRTLWWHSWLITKVLRIYPYFIFHYSFNKVILQHTDCAAIWNRSKPFDAIPPHHLQLFAKQDDIESAFAVIDERKIPVFKLDWRVNCQAPYWHAVLNKLTEIKFLP